MIATNEPTFTPSVREAKAIAGISMVLVLVSFSMLFATLFLGYAALRFTAPVWPPMGMTDLPMAVPLVSTALIALSSLTWMLFENSKRRLWILLTFALGLGFTISQFVLWADLKQLGIYASTGTFASIIYAFTWIHAAHIIAALLLLLWPITWSVKQTITEVRTVKVASIGKFWHFLGIIWFLMFISLFLF